MNNILKDLRNCWLSSTGKIIIKDKEFDETDSCAWHERLGLCILRDLWNVPTFLDAFEQGHNKSSWQSTSELESLGYVRLHGFGGLSPNWIIPYKKILTKKQEIVILDWCEINNKEYNNCFTK